MPLAVIFAVEEQEGMPDRKLGPNEAALASGLAAALVLSIVEALTRIVGINALNTELLLGALILRKLSLGALILGFALRLTINTTLGLFYGAAFRSLESSGAKTGAVLGLAHWICAGLALGFLGTALPASAGMLEPGFLSIQLGTTSALCSLGLHALFGATLGHSYWRARADYNAHADALSVRKAA